MPVSQAQIGLLTDYFSPLCVDLPRSAVIGDRDTDLQLARNLGVRGLRARLEGTLEESWSGIAETLSARELRGAPHARDHN